MYYPCISFRANSSLLKTFCSYNYGWFSRLD